MEFWLSALTVVVIVLGAALGCVLSWSMDVRAEADKDRDDIAFAIRETCSLKDHIHNYSAPGHEHPYAPFLHDHEHTHPHEHPHEHEQYALGTVLDEQIVDHYHPHGHDYVAVGHPDATGGVAKAHEHNYSVMAGDGLGWRCLFCGRLRSQGQ